MWNLKWVYTGTRSLLHVTLRIAPMSACRMLSSVITCRMLHDIHIGPSVHYPACGITDEADSRRRVSVAGSHGPANPAFCQYRQGNLVPYIIVYVLYIIYIYIYSISNLFVLIRRDSDEFCLLEDISSECAVRQTIEVASLDQVETRLVLVHGIQYRLQNNNIL